MVSKADVLKAIRDASSEKSRQRQEFFGIRNTKRYGLTQPQIRTIAKWAGKNQALALALWETGIHEARHVAIQVAVPEQMTSRLMDRWMRDFDTWDIVDGACMHLIRKSPLAWKKAVQWTARKGEYQKRAGFALLACLAVHDKQAQDSSFQQVFRLAAQHASDDRHYVWKSVSWALRQTGKRNDTLRTKAIALALKLTQKGDRSAKRIATEVLRELTH